MDSMSISSFFFGGRPWDLAIFLWLPKVPTDLHRAERRGSLAPWLRGSDGRLRQGIALAARHGAGGADEAHAGAGLGAGVKG